MVTIPVTLPVTLPIVYNNGRLKSMGISRNSEMSSDWANGQGMRERAQDKPCGLSILQLPIDMIFLIINAI